MTAYDPDHEQIQQALKTVIALLAPWRRTGRLPGTEEERRAARQGVACACGLMWADRVGAGHTAADTGEIMVETPGEAGVEPRGDI
ncbi:hypothetical protein IPZ58_29540 [Streptomyces roseoverticillatus]|uniref:hypothetical protein n=1 Tax=Streptomyces roseoverticillatus TaxID=66429 RepID=UPI001F397FA6|nr:hypothetical protein [Streptomyces roseoverticillatus]MCF3105707.1 hypothetical protein [Streptomyces roseoverticillatus]